MTTTITPNLTAFLEDLKRADLVGISLNPKTLGLRLDFTFGPEVDDVVIELNSIIHLVFSQPPNPENEEICFWVGEVYLKQIEKNDPKFFSYSPYPFQNQGTFDTEMSDIPTHPLTGKALLQKVKELGDLPRREIAKRCGYYTVTKDKQIRVNLTAFYDAVLAAKKVPQELESLTSNTNSSSLIYFRLEGDICLEVVCGNYKIFQ